ncbi:MULTISPECIES: NAD-dependent epimerase/dehydratase family protein [Gluconobacter]|uniref:NAD-dependent epimerase/dehydratase family protein n=1 Tax=Gluconobacter TaxID=441 RepID=UPI000A3984C3|nr:MULTISPECIES: NAD-dependent epimerase/dehydratase family protein [Gluconobacter]MBS1039165.1 NAD-dependent epimerase/dehydratase family protein [Gluconobacter cerinus]
MLLNSRETHLVLGGSGFIGRSVCARLLEDGHRVIVASRRPVSGFLSNAASRVDNVVGDLMTTDWDRLVAQADVVHHYAWSSIPASANADPSGDLESNMGIMFGLLNALHRRGQGRIVFASSGGTVYGRVTAAPVGEHHPLLPITAYGAGKVTAETYLRLYHDLYGLDCRIARISNPFGVGQNLTRGQGAVTTFLHKAMLGEEIVLWGDGSVVRDYLHISDLTDALLLLARASDLSGETTFNVGSGVGVSLNAVIALIGQKLERAVRVSRLPSRAFDVPVNVLDISALKRRLNWAPSLSFSEGLDRAIETLSRAATPSRG